MAQKPSIPKGTRDFSPTEVAKRTYIMNTIREQFQRYGFQPIETPSFENSSTLMGKYGEEGDRLIFKILESGEYFDSVKNNLFSIPKFQNDIKSNVKHSYKVVKGYFSSNKNSWNLYYDNYEILLRDVKKELSLNPGYFQSKVLDKYFSSRREYLSKKLIELYRESKDNLRLENGFLNNLIKEIYERNVTAFMNENKYRVYKRFRELSSSDITPEISEKALRYDLTVPFARYVVQHQNDIVFPFKRYQIQPVWRADRPQKGRFREFYQCDADVVGSDSLWQEVEFVQLYDAVFTALQLEGVTIKMNNRKILSGIAEVIGASDKLIDFTVALDKLDKIGEEGVTKEMLSKGITQAAIDKIAPLFSLTGSFGDQLTTLKTLLADSETGIQGIEEMLFINNAISDLGLQSANLQLDVTLARGLNYYTGAIFEVTAPDGVAMGSIGGGGRYADLTGIFGLKDVSGVGISFGLDRIYLVLEELDLFPEEAVEGVKAFFINFGDTEAGYALQAITKLRAQGIAAELYPDKVTSGKQMKKQMTYAHRRGIPFVILAGDQEVADKTFTVKDMTAGTQETVTLDVLLQKLK